MPEEAPRVTVRSLEPDVRALWRARHLPPPTGVLGPSDGAIARQFEGSFAVGDPPELVAHRAVAADVDARHLVLAGRGASGTLRYDPRPEEVDPDRIGPLLEALGVWTGGATATPWDSTDRKAGVQAIVSRLARQGILAARDGPLRLCLSCRVPRTPERIIYQKEVGDTFLVRFPLQGTDPPVDALVWVDAPWRLLGASALLVHPDVPYAVVEYRHKGSSALLLVSHGALARLRAWLPDVELAVREERPGREWVGRAYAYPLRHEFPIGGALDPPGGTIQSDIEVGDTGTGIVPLVPGHGPTDAEIADRLGIAGWPLLTPSGLLDPNLMHKYAGLDVETANEFVARDLSESGAVLARLRVVRGVPYCAICGHRMVWTPGRAWCLEPVRLPPEQKERYARLLPHDRPIGQIEVARWPISETSVSRDPEAVALLECARCERLDGPDGPRACPCGGTRRLIARRLLPSIGGAFGAWSRTDPMPRADSVRIYVNERRRAPALVHHLSAMTGIDAAVSEISLTVVPTVARVDLAALVAAHGADAVRAAFVRTAGAGGSTTTFEERCRQEEARFAAFFAQAQRVVAASTPEILREGARPPDVAARDLEVEDRAILARWARTHLRVLASYDRGLADAAHRQLFRFLERDLLEYLEITRSRLDFAGTPATKRGALRTLVYLFRAAALALAPIAPFTAEAVHRRLLGEARSVFESTDLGGDRTLVNEDLAAAWDRWHAVIRSADAFRRAHHLGPATVLPVVALVFRDEETAARLRADRATVERLARIARLEVTSPQVPWAARQRRLVPVESEIQRAYPALASQIVHLLERMPPRRSTELPGRELTVAIHGVPRTITPEMVTMVDTLPEGYAPTPYPPGEMYVQPPGAGGGTAAPPPLSPDAFWLVRRVQRRLPTPTPGGDAARGVAIVSAVDPLAAELRDKASAIALYLGLQELRVVGTTPESLPHAQLEGRTRTGARWSVSLPGVAGRARRTKRRASSSDGRRVPPPREPIGAGEVDYADEKVIAREEAIRDLGRELDELFAAPLLGPAKVTLAWEAGLRSMQEFSDAPFEQIEALAGFGRPVASTLWAKLGRPLPTGPARTRRARVERAVAAPRVAPDAIPAPHSPVSEPPPVPAPAAPEAAPLLPAEADAPTSRLPVPLPTGPTLPHLLEEPTVPPAEPSPPPEAGADVPVEAVGPALEVAEPPDELVPPTPEEPTPSSEPTAPGITPSAESVVPETPSSPSGEPVVTEASGMPEVVDSDLEAVVPEGEPTAPESPSVEPGPDPTSTPVPSEPPPAPAEPAAPPPETPPEPHAEPVVPETASPSELPSAPSAELLPGDTVEATPPPEPEPRPDSAAAPPHEPAAGSSEGVSADAPPPITGSDGPADAPALAAPTDLPPGGAEPAPAEPERADSASDTDGAAPAPPPSEPSASIPDQRPAEVLPESALQPSSEAVAPEGPPSPEWTPGSEPGIESSDEAVVAPPVPETGESVPQVAGDSPVPTEIPEAPPAPVSSVADDRPAIPDELLTPPPTDEDPALGAGGSSEPASSTPESSELPYTTLDDRPVEPEPTTTPEATPPVPSDAPPEGGAAPAPEQPEVRGDAEPTVTAPTPSPAPEVPSAAPKDPAPALEVDSPTVPPGPPLVPAPEPVVESPAVPAAPPVAPVPVLAASPPAPPIPEPLPAPPPPPCGVEADFSSALFMALQPFLDATAAGHRGIALVRELPERIRVHIGPRPVEVYWLTNLDRPRTVRPSDLPAVVERLHRALDEDGVTAVFLEGIEYLAGVHGVDRVSDFLREIDADARQHVARIWVHFTPSLLSEASLDRLLAAIAPPGVRSSQ
ncbi:MAG TPA: DUF835 domain-containing protein [Thermoplasmata archaeon]|nr:DUF835 domain-containing protein [Thermoplasmata archaeon]